MPADQRKPGCSGPGQERSRFVRSDPDDAFDVIIPSLPGFAFSGLPPTGPVTPPVIADLWARLMSDVLGYSRFGAYGGDIGSHVTGFLGARHRDVALAE